MTLAIGIKYPVKQLNRLLKQGSVTPEAIVLASDSRWTYPDGHYKDYGTKLFQLGDDTGAVYAGSSALGELCLTGLRNTFRNQKLRCSFFQEIAQQTFKEVYNQYSKEIPYSKRVLYILLGICKPSGEAELYRFRFDTDFEPERLTEIQTIGCREPRMIFEKSLKHELDRQVRKELSSRRRHREDLAYLNKLGLKISIPITPYHIAMIAGCSLNTIVESGVSIRVGGKLQCAVITKEDGFHLLSLAHTIDPTNKGPGFTKATIQQSKLETAIPGLFGCYSLND